MTQATWRKRSEWPLLAASIIFLGAYSVQVIGNTEAPVVEVLVWGTWVVFAADYAVNLWLAPQRGRWFLRNLHELAIVALPALRPLRLLRLVTLLRVMHGIGGNALRGRILTYVLGSAVLLVYAGALAILDVEADDPGANVTNIGDAIWWAIATITTVGYGDYYPVTVLGRCVAVGLMIGGIAVLGVVTASVASWMVESVAGEAVTEMEAAESPVREELRQLTAKVERLTALLEERGLPASGPALEARDSLAP
ncbi:potassium channel family protein [Pseudarthrobacter sp. NS4]|uniref:potassium channel family protein n=1 Tax=Pseudarthrobacter sp. NS4 TaxID=2973976 RepID=UPI002161EA7D|nr:potassium channel family protein [Pseudarthrobacter sp. NS4]